MNLQPTIPFIEAQRLRGQRHGRLMAYTMFTDISGFTVLTARLMEQGKEGAEILSNILNNIFGSLVHKVYEAGGVIPHFAGDAFMSIFPADVCDAERVLNTGFQIRHFFESNPIQYTRFGNFRVQVRIGVAYGEVEWGLTRQNIVWFRGEGIDEAAAAQRRAQPHELIAQERFKSCFEHYELTFTRLAVRWQVLDNNIEKNINLNVASFPAEFRRVVAVFIQIEENAQILDYQSFNKFAELIIAHFEQFSGYFKEIDFGDKGAMLVGFFGAPVSFELNEGRALEFAFTLREVLKNAGNVDFRFKISLTVGLAYAGEVGGLARRQYAIAGKSVNLAARMVQYAAWGEIVVDKQLIKNQPFIFDKKADIQYKGFSEPTPIYALIRRTLTQHRFSAEKYPLIGRDVELQALQNHIQWVFTQQKGGVFAIFGEAGAGKSRLLYELKQYFLKQKKQQVCWMVCQCDRILRKPFNPFVYGLKNYFKQSVEYSIAENRHRFDKVFKNISIHIKEKLSESWLEAWQRTESVLAALIGLHVAADSLWEQLDAKGRYDNIILSLKIFFEILSKLETLFIELEDTHWADADSENFVQYFVPSFSVHRIVLLLTTRYSDEGTKQHSVSPQFLKQNGVFYAEIELKLLEAGATAQLIENQLKSKVETSLVELMQRMANGNPFYIEQIVAYFKENNLLRAPQKERPFWHLSPHFKVNEWKILTGDSIQAILTARIDRLSSMVKETVKAAAVIGREFELPVLTEVMNLQHLASSPYLGTLHEWVKNAEKGQIWGTIDEVRYIFRHTLLREAVYEMQLKNRVRLLHGLIAKAIQKIYKDSIEERVFDLAFHYEQAENKPKALLFLRKAAAQARLRFQNIVVLNFYDRQLKWLYEPHEQKESAQILLEKGSILQLTGQWRDAALHFYEAYDRAELLNDVGLKADSIAAIAHLMMLKGDYIEAKKGFEAALKGLENVESMDYEAYKHLKNPKSAIILGHLGNLYFRQADYQHAETAFLNSIALFEVHRAVLGKVSPQIVSNLGLTYMNQGKYEEGVHAQKSALWVCEQLGDTLGRAILSINIGIVFAEQGNDDAALQYFEQGLELAKQLSNKQLESIVIGCIGNIHRLKGDLILAAAYLEEDMRLTRELGDRQGIAIACELLGKLYIARAEYAIAFQYLKESQKLCELLHYKKGIAKALHGLGEIYLAQKSPQKAIDLFDQAIQIAYKINNQFILGQCFIDKSKSLYQLNDFKNAQKIEATAISIAQQLGNERLKKQLIT